MAIYRSKNKQQYTNIDAGVFRDQELSLKARGMLVTILSFPDSWVFSVAGLKKIFKKDGSAVLEPALKNWNGPDIWCGGKRRIRMELLPDMNGMCMRRRRK